MEYGVLTPRQREALKAAGKKLLRLRGDVYIDDTRIPGEMIIAGSAGILRPKENF
jgi:hypothetical protein